MSPILRPNRIVTLPSSKPRFRPTLVPPLTKPGPPPRKLDTWLAIVALLSLLLFSGMFVAYVMDPGMKNMAESTSDTRNARRP
jgi:hypothetical protein